jgi:hypothetical protein
LGMGADLGDISRPDLLGYERPVRTISFHALVSE